MREKERGRDREKRKETEIRDQMDERGLIYK